MRVETSSRSAFPNVALLLLVLGLALPARPDEHAHVSGQRAPAVPPPVSSSADVPFLDWDGLFVEVRPTRAELRSEVRALEGRRVRFRGHAVVQPVPAGGLFLTRRPHERLHPDDAESLPWDAVGLVWRTGLSLNAVPRRPSVEGTLRLGSRRLGDETVLLVLEDAVPWVPHGS
ncbi:MAG: hypothetical protein RBU36_10560 [Thermoanaerobaculia bacterium]|jgi:hypothetical protein|nr:hypothetical protein [Thermoanaerobaculia bacterium]